jgi:predicted  nucleic acid-binding Zn-ribbon protein
MKKYLLLLMSLAVATTAISQQISLTNFNTEVFIENFSTNSSQFNYETTSENYFIVDDGDLFLSRNNKISDFTIFSSTPFNEENYKLKTSIKLIPTNSKATHVGILLNTQLDGNGLLSIEINTKKEYRVRQINNGESKYLSGNRDNEGWIPSSLIKENGEYNYIDILCYKGRYDLYFNFQYVNTFESPEYTSGRFGFLIGNQSQARIDYVHVHKEGGRVSSVDFNNANDKILKLENDILSLQKEIDQLNTENSNSIQELNNIKQNETTLLIEKETLGNKITYLNIKLNEANESKDEIASESSELKKAIINYEKTSKNLEEKNNNLLNQLDLKINELTKLQNNLSKSTSELNKKTIEASSLSNKLKESEQKLKDATSSKASLKNSNENFKVETLELNRKIVTQSNKIKIQETNLSDLNSKINSLTDQKEKINNQLTNLNSKVNELTKANNSISNNLLESEKRVENEQNKSQSLKNQITNVKNKNLKNQETITLLNSRIKSLNDSISSLFKDYSLLLIKEEELNKLKTKHNQLTINNQDGKTIIEKLKLENEKLNSQLVQQKQIAAQFAESYRYELEKSKRFQEEILNFQSELTLETTNNPNAVYKIQLGIFDEEINVEGLDLVSKINTDNNQFIYLSGSFKDYKSARNYLIKVNELGFKNAFIVKF